MERFESLVERPAGRDACWVWQGALTRGGYGRFHSTAGPTTSLAHRWYWWVRVGPLQPGLVLDHICRNRACVRLDHLRPVSPAVNTLAGDGPSARNARKVVCSKGHELEVVLRPLRRCPVCHREAMRRAQPRQRLAAAQAEREAFEAEWARLPHLGGYRASVADRGGRPPGRPLTPLGVGAGRPRGGASTAPVDRSEGTDAGSAAQEPL